MKKLLCKLGIHKMKNMHNTGRYGLPMRYCVHCMRQQGLFRGCGRDDWLWLQPEKEKEDE